MNPFSLSQFYKLPSVVQILFAEFLMTLFLGAAAPYAYRAIWPRELSYTPLPLDWTDYAFFACGVPLLIWLMWGPMFPRVAAVSWTPSFRGGGAIVYNPSWTVDYGFLTNHPSYVLIDALVLGMWWFFRVIMSDGWAERVYEANLWVSIASIVPIWRLFCWYILRRRPAAMVRNAWMPIANLYVYFILPLAIAIALMFAYEAIKSRRAMAAMPTIEAHGFDERRFAELRDPELKDKEQTRIIKLRATQISREAIRCFDGQRQPSVAVLADFGRHGHLVIQNEITARTHGLETLVERAKDNAGKPIEAMGRLQRMPADRDIPSWRRPFYCGLERTVPRPRWLLEESRP